MKDQDAIVPALSTRNNHVSTAKVSVFATGEARVSAKVISFVPPATILMPVTVTSFPAFDQVKNLTFLPIHSLLINVSVVIFPVVPPFAVRVLDQSIHHPQDPAPNVPARAMFGI